MEDKKHKGLRLNIDKKRTWTKIRTKRKMGVMYETIRGQYSKRMCEQGFTETGDETRHLIRLERVLYRNDTMTSVVLWTKINIK